MKMAEVMVVKIYITEGSKLLETILHYLQKDAAIRGVTVFRAIGGYGETGTRTSSFVDLSLSLPIAIEFFDYPDKVNAALAHLSTIVKAEHIVSWKAYANETE